MQEVVRTSTAASDGFNASAFGAMTEASASASDDSVVMFGPADVLGSSDIFTRRREGFNKTLLCAV
jgi:hypothetical protein